MIIGKKYVSQISSLVILFCLNLASVSQTTSASDDILDYLPAIIAGVTRDAEASPTAPEPPTSGLGNYRSKRTEIFNRLQPMGKVSEFINSWDSTGNITEGNLTVFGLFGGNPSEIRMTVVSNTNHDEQNRPISSSYNSTIDANTRALGNKQYRYQNGKLQSTSGQSILTSNVTGTNTSNIETVFQYTDGNRLIGATVTFTRLNNSIVTTEQHTVAYNSNNRVNSQRVVRTDNVTNIPEETLHTHRYDFTGNLIESITVTATNQEIVKTFQTITGNQVKSTILARDQASGAVVSNSLIIATYKIGVCVLRGPNDPFVIEGNITASFPYSPNVGCIKR